MCPSLNFEGDEQRDRMTKVAAELRVVAVAGVGPQSQQHAVSQLTSRGSALAVVSLPGLAFLSLVLQTSCCCVRHCVSVQKKFFSFVDEPQSIPVVCNPKP